MLNRYSIDAIAYKKGQQLVGIITSLIPYVSFASLPKKCNRHLATSQASFGIPLSQSNYKMTDFCISGQKRRQIQYESNKTL